MMLLIMYLLLALSVSFLCSILEAVLLSVPQSHVAVLVEKGSPTGRHLQRMKEDVDQPLAAILTLNTFAHTLGAAGVGAQATFLWGEAWVGVVSVVLTLLVLVFSEIIPKTIGAVHSKRLAPLTVRITQYLIISLRPIVKTCNWISLLVSGQKKAIPHLSRDEIRSFAQLALDGGAIDETEATVLRNLIALRDIRVESIMTPRTVVYTLQAAQSVSDIAREAPPPFSRIPIVKSTLDDVIGFVHRRDIFNALSEKRADAQLGELARPLHVIPESSKLSTVLREFVQRRELLFLVTDEFGGAEGIVTLEDVIESLLGVEIVDETDAVEDMQQLAKRRHRDKIDS